MSDDVQFVFITHNKITMEIANQLLGVTMYEAGVSRRVSVDVDEAVCRLDACKLIKSLCLAWRRVRSWF